MISAHAEDELIIRNIPRKLLEKTLNEPQHVIASGESRVIHQSKVLIDGRYFLLRVVTAHATDAPVVVTVYRTTKIRKYWKAE